MTSQFDSDPRYDASRDIRAPRGPERTCKNWGAEAAYRMIQNNLDKEVAENPKHLVSTAASAAPPATGNATTRSWRRCASWKTTRPC